MEVSMQDERTLTELDYARLERLMREAGATADLTPIETALDAAQSIVPARKVDPDVVTMCSRVMVADLHTHETQELTLCYPPEANASTGHVSVLSPVGAALLGRRVGEVARWRTPDGREGMAKVVALPFQPEASGHYTL